MKYADLHIHSSFSDGCLSPEEIVEEAKNKKISFISITDHDTISSQYVTRMKIDNLEIIPGVEFSALYKECEIHILGYYIDLDNKLLNDVLDSLKKLRVERAKEIAKKLSYHNIHIDIEKMLKNEKAVIGRGNIASEMIEKGYVCNYGEAFYKYLMKGKMAYVKGEKKDYKEILNVIRSSNGIAVLAHPGKIYRSANLELMIKDLKCYGLQGIEVYHPSHTRNQINSFYNLSKKYKLLITGGSDFHNTKNDQILLASQGINKLLMEKIIKFKLNQ